MGTPSESRWFERWLRMSEVTERRPETVVLTGDLDVLLCSLGESSTKVLYLKLETLRRITPMRESFSALVTLGLENGLDWMMVRTTLIPIVALHLVLHDGIQDPRTHVCVHEVHGLPEEVEDVVLDGILVPIRGLVILPDSVEHDNPSLIGFDARYY
jgi:hypothetical protein